VIWEAEVGGSLFVIGPNKKLKRSCLKNKPSLVEIDCNPSYTEGRGRRIIVWPQQKHKTLSENKLNKKT
jgi:hypothetical protein